MLKIIVCLKKKKKVFDDPRMTYQKNLTKGELNQQPCALHANALPLNYTGFSLQCNKNRNK